MVDTTHPGIAISFKGYLAEYAGRRYEYINGHAVPMEPEITTDGETMVAPTKFGHGKLTGRLHTRLGAHVLKHELGEVLGAETGFPPRLTWL